MIGDMAPACAPSLVGTAPFLVGRRPHGVSATRTALNVRAAEEASVVRHAEWRLCNA
jgi:hypothetical protein